MSWRDFFSIISTLVLRKLPGWLARSLYPAERLREDLELDLRSTRGLSFSLGHSPNGWAWLRLTNKSPLAVEVQHAEVEVWDGQPVCKLTHTGRVIVAAKKTAEIYCADFINEWQERRVHEARVPGSGFTVSARLLLTTPYGAEELRVMNKEGVHGEVSGTPSAAVAVGAEAGLRRN